MFARLLMVLGIAALGAIAQPVSTLIDPQRQPEDTTAAADCTGTQAQANAPHCRNKKNSDSARVVPAPTDEDTKPRANVNPTRYPNPTHRAE